MSNSRKALSKQMLLGSRRDPVEINSMKGEDGQPGVVYLGPIPARVIVLVQEKFGGKGSVDSMKFNDEDMDFFAKIMARVVVDEDGKRIFDDESAKDFADVEFEAFTDILGAFMKLGTAGAVSGKAPSPPPTAEEASSDSPSDSPAS